MKTRLLIASLYIKAGLILFGLGFFSGIWWILTGNDFADKLIKPVFRRINQLIDQNNII